MIIRCDLHTYDDITLLAQSRRLGEDLIARGHRVAYAVNRRGHEAARRYLGNEPSIYRVPEDCEDEDIARMEHLQRRHGHQNLLVNLRQPTSSWLFHMSRRYPYLGLMDRGSRFMVYANLIVNWRLDAREHTYSCSPTARLLLGPKFYPSTPSPLPDSGGAVTNLLLMLGNDGEPITPVLTALSEIGYRGGIHIFCARDGGPFELLGARSAGWPNLAPKPLHGDEGGPIPFNQYGLVITQADEGCFEPVASGAPTITMAVSRDQLRTAYTLEQIGAAPTFGRFGSMKISDMVAMLVPLLTRSDKRQELRDRGAQLFDGEGVGRIAQFFPKEPVS